jgi:hypothetical protein
MTRHICQGPECHTYKTQSRIRGVKGAKVLRTRTMQDTDMTTSFRLGLIQVVGLIIFAMSDVCKIG